MRISSNFDSGSVEVVDASDPSHIRLRLRHDNAAEFCQWFHFRVLGVAGTPLTMTFENAADAVFADGWPDYRALASYDHRNWFRVATTSYEDGCLVIRHTPERDNVYYAYFEPYSFERHMELLGMAESSPWAQVVNLGASAEDRDIDLIVVGRPRPDRKPVWITARQHPGETMSEWFVEGLLERLLDTADPVARRVRELACLYIVPNMNPDGAVRGNLRSNALGVNLNREWRDPSLERSPEVLLVRDRMERTGVSLYLDIHGDESLNYVFFSTADEVPGFTAEVAAQQARFSAAFRAASPDFQSEHGYVSGRFGDELLTLASKWVAWHHKCLSLTLEMPFKDNANLPDGLTGWSAARSKRLGAAILLPLLDFLQQ